MGSVDRRVARLARLYGVPSERDKEAEKRTREGRDGAAMRKLLRGKFLAEDRGEYEEEPPFEESYQQGQGLARQAFGRNINRQEFAQMCARADETTKRLRREWQLNPW